MARKGREIRKDLADTRRELRRLHGAVGDDFGCDGTADAARELRWEIAGLESELAEYRSRERAEDAREVN
jgi:phage host-nuclease inhibitor protein Gam